MSNIMLDHSATAENQKGNEVFVATREVEVGEDKSARYLQWGLWGIGGATLVYMVFFTNESSFIVGLLKGLLGCLPAVWFFWQKKQVEAEFAAQQQKINGAASQIDNYNLHRLEILKNLENLVKRSVSQDSEIYGKIAAFRSGINPETQNRNEVAGRIDQAFGVLMSHFESYPDLKSQNIIAEAIQENRNLMGEITSAREIYNNKVTQWNREIFQWPIKKLVAHEMGLHTMIPFALSAVAKQETTRNFFE